MKNIFADIKSVAVIVAHPDDEIIWPGGTILSHPEISWTILSLCRKSDPDRAPKFFKVAGILNAKSLMADIDDGPDQLPLEQTIIQTTILNNLSETNFDIIFTHSPAGEYTRHLRHQEVSQAVLSLWNEGKLKAKSILLFAYEDGGKKYLPRPIKNADIVVNLAENIWQNKKDIIINSYGFSPDSFEAQSCSEIETFWLIKEPKALKKIIRSFEK